jgi:hypothetical protein
LEVAKAINQWSKGGTRLLSIRYSRYRAATQRFNLKKSEKQQENLSEITPDAEIPVISTRKGSVADARKVLKEMYERVLVQM